MKIDRYGQQVFSEAEICDAFMKDPIRVIKKILVENPVIIPSDLEIINVPNIELYKDLKISVEKFDQTQIDNWHMPIEYKEFDIAKFVLDQCQTQEELQRAGDELLMFQERKMFPLLCYLKFLVDTMRKNNIVWGVGRGSSVASFVLFLIGIHKINSLYYDLPIEEFLK
jgi:DNA polymerase III alpha subunit